MPTVSVAAQRLHAHATLRSAEDSPGFVPDAHLPTDLYVDLAAVELCLAGIWVRTTGGYLVTDIPLLRHALDVRQQLDEAPTDCVARGYHQEVASDNGRLVICVHCGELVRRPPQP